MISFKTNKGGESVAKIVIENGEPYIYVLGAGSATFTVYSIYNTGLEASFSINVINAVSAQGGFEYYKNISYSHSTINFLKNQPFFVIFTYFSQVKTSVFLLYV